MAAKRLRELPNLARLPGIERSRRYDLRFSWSTQGGPRGKSLREVFAKAATRPPGQSAVAERIATAVGRAEYYDFRAELQSIGEALARRITENEAAQALRVSVFVASFGLDGLDARQEALGAHFGVTGTRISQLLRPMREQLAKTTVWSPAAELFMERLSKFKGEAFEHRLERERTWLCGADIKHFWAFTREVLKLPTGVGEAIKLWQSVDKFLGGGAAALQGLAVALERPVATTLDRCGVGHVNHVIGRAVVDGHLGSLPGSSALEVLRQMQGVVFLGKDSNWFARLPVEEGVLLRRVRKILTVATKGLHLLEIYEAMCSDNKWWDESNEEHPLPPPSILGEWLSKVPWIETTASGKVRLLPSAPKSKFSTLEAAVLKSMEARGGLALVSEVTEDCARAGLEPSSIRVTLVTSVFVRQVVLGIYALRGREIDRARYIEAMAAMERLNIERGRRMTAGRSAEGTEGAA